MVRKKKVAPQAPDNKDMYYVGIEDASDMRKEVLFAAKSLIVSLKKYEQIKTGRRLKIELFSQLKTKIKEINLLLDKLKNLMPETKIRHIPMKKRVAAKEKVKIAQAKKAPVKDQERQVVKQQENEIDKLEKELRMIEKKLHMS